MYSDNGTNLIGAHNLLKIVDWKKVNSYCHVSRIEWRFNPPSAAWWGGWWERLVRIVKDILRRSLGKAALDSDEMRTLLCECGAIVNARPLTHLADDKDGFTAITPEMFLKEIRQDTAPDLNFLKETSLGQRFKYLQRLRQEIRKRFRAEYLGQLTRYTKSVKNYCKIKEGDVVLVASDNRKRLDWPLGLVKQVVPGNDGVPCIARIKTASGELVRPLQRLVVLETAQLNEEDKPEKRENLINEISPNQNEEKIQNSHRIDTSENCDDSKEKTDVDIKTKVTRRGRAIKLPNKFSKDFVSH